MIDWGQEQGHGRVKTAGRSPEKKIGGHGVKIKRGGVPTLLTNKQKKCQTLQTGKGR